MPARPGRGPSLQDLAREREAAYRFLGTLLLPPTPAVASALPGAARALRRTGRALTRLAVWTPWLRLLDAAATVTFEDLAADYRRRFAPRAGRSPLCESAWGPPADVPVVIATLEREYAAAGFAPAPGCAEPPDHAAVELEFLGLLCGREAEAWAREDHQAAADALARQARFLEEHLARWFGDLGRTLAARDGAGLIALASEAAWAFIAHDRRLLPLILGRLPRAAR
jgi:TorA maturation chaperone TorD